MLASRLKCIGNISWVWAVNHFILLDALFAITLDFEDLCTKRWLCISSNLRVWSLFLLILAESWYKFWNCIWIIERSDDSTEYINIVFIDNNISALTNEFWILHELKEDLLLFFLRNYYFFKHVLREIKILRKIDLISCLWLENSWNFFV